jgi:hypothetical protein
MSLEADPEESAWLRHRQPEPRSGGPSLVEPFGTAHGSRESVGLAHDLSTQAPTVGTGASANASGRVQKPLRRRQPLAVYRIIDEAELLGESTDASSVQGVRRLQGGDAISLPPGDESKTPSRWLRTAHGHRRLIAAILSVSAVAIAGVSTINRSVTIRRRHFQALRTSPVVSHFKRRPIYHSRARPHASVEGRKRRRHRDTKASITGASVDAARAKMVHAAVRPLAPASSCRCGWQSVQQVAHEFGFER